MLIGRLRMLFISLGVLGFIKLRFVHFVLNFSNATVLATLRPTTFLQNLVLTFGHIVPARIDGCVVVESLRPQPHCGAPSETQFQVWVGQSGKRFAFVPTHP